MSKKKVLPGTSINHGSVYARVPELAARNLATLVDGAAQPFHPCEGGWACFLNGDIEDWESPLIEFYPCDVSLVQSKGTLIFSRLKPTSARAGAGTHFNLTVPKTRTELEQRCKKLGLPFSWRDWQSVLEVWLEQDLLIECVPR
jgi:hypothetical protein